jgi:hypothetical protein
MYEALVQPAISSERRSQRIDGMIASALGEAASLHNRLDAGSTVRPFTGSRKRCCVALLALTEQSSLRESALLLRMRGRMPTPSFPSCFASRRHQRRLTFALSSAT